MTGHRPLAHPVRVSYQLIWSDCVPDIDFPLSFENGNTDKRFVIAFVYRKKKNSNVAPMLKLSERRAFSLCPPGDQDRFYFDIDKMGSYNITVTLSTFFFEKSLILVVFESFEALDSIKQSLERRLARAATAFESSKHMDPRQMSLS